MSTDNDILLTENTPIDIISSDQFANLDQFDYSKADVTIHDFEENSDEDINEYSASDSEDVEGAGTSKSGRLSIKKAFTKLTLEFKGLMGEANLRFARGDLETAQQMCFEVIRQIPNAYEPYLTLAQFYESTDRAKCKNYLMIASYLYPSNSSTWCRLAEMSLEEGNHREAIQYYSKAVSGSPGDIELHRKRIQLAEFLGDDNLVTVFKMNLARHLPPKHHQEIINLVSEVAKKLHSQKKLLKTLYVLEIPFKRIPKYVTQDLINMMLELLLARGRYSQCLDIFVDFCNFKFEIHVIEENKIIIDKYTMPENIQVDLKTKFIVCAIKLNCFDIVTPLVKQMALDEDVETLGDLFLDICEALVSVDQHLLALDMYVPLTKSKNFSLAAVWLKFAECLEVCRMKEQAIDGYFTVLMLAPQHVEVLQPLANLLLATNKTKEALEVMAYQTPERLDIALLIVRLRLLKQLNDVDEYWKCAEFLLSRHGIVLKYPEEIKVATIVRYVDKLARIAKIRQFRGDNEEIQPMVKAHFIREPSAEEEYEIFKEILEFSLEKKRTDLFQKFVFMGLSSKKFEKNVDELYVFAFFACLFQRDAFHGYSLARNLVLLHPQNNLVWNLFNMGLQSSDDNRHCRFIERQHTRMPELEGLEMLEANNDIVFGNYSNAINYFLKEFKQNMSPYASFVLGVIILQLSHQRTVSIETKKQLTETTTYLFLYYAKHRSEKAAQEVYYNLGRMYHQLGIMYLAEHYYKEVLKVKNDLLDKYPEILGLKQEAAYNLHLIYKNSNNFTAARNILYEHIVI